MITPVDPAYDFHRVLPEQVVAGSRFLFTLETRGEVYLTPDLDPDTNMWVFILLDSEGGISGAFIPDDAQTAPLYVRYYLWRRNAKPAVGAQFTGPGGSQWVYQRSGTYRCWAPGGGFVVDDVATRGIVDSVVSDGPPIVDPLWDWEPITDGSVINVGDNLLWWWGVADVVDSVFDGGDYLTFYNAAFETLGTLTRDDTLNHTAVVDRNAYAMNDKPTVGARFRSTDGAEWIFAGSGNYRCYKPGSTFAVDALYQYLDIPGGLTAI